MRGGWCSGQGESCCVHAHALAVPRARSPLSTLAFPLSVRPAFTSSPPRFPSGLRGHKGTGRQLYNEFGIIERKGESTLHAVLGSNSAQGFGYQIPARVDM